MPRRKYGHMVGPCPPTPIENCRACRLGIPCPKHDLQKKPDYKALAKTKRHRKTGGKKGKRKRLKTKNIKQKV
ncbi:MAG: hypothetical protein JSV56_05075 [Methanomassiliicoccales archaeon]|nr:MAG: hypothetical protein JSV56_05075 [Methanomassiliicoccales archaeon]